MASAPFTMRPIGLVRSPYTETTQIPKGPGAQHDAEGVLEIRPDLALGLTDIEGFSHLYVLWVFDRAAGYELLGTPPTDTTRAYATRTPRRPKPIGLTVVQRCAEARACTCGGGYARPPILTKPISAVTS
jgi:tRNA (Thr-GGU) A37 N-methylase